MNSPAHILGEDGTDIELTGSADNYEITLQLFAQANRSIDIFSQQLNDAIFNHLALIDQLKRFLLAAHTNQVRILLRDTEHLIKTRNHLFNLAQRITSNLAVKKIHPDYAADPQDFLIVDGRGIIRRPHGERFEGIANFNHPGPARELSDYFDEVWNHSTPVSDIKRLYI
ncbi:MAG: hypothetical protein OEZ39_10515 [Gammaproteobacteria bacterium]|nr:hypothetical protein [Gammaproteobacteria bacterium]MDH5652275.1 hypothetical protein [Gammaproteobacteria bacterium]